MKTLTVSAARKRFGSVLDAVQQKPIIVRRKNGDEVVIVPQKDIRRFTALPASSPSQSSQHKKDEFFEVALIGRAELIIMGDADLLGIHPWREIEILSPADYLRDHR